MKKTQALFRKLKNNNPKREIIEITCGGGLGNRIINLICGLESAQISNQEPIISWPTSSACRASSSDLFDSTLQIKEEEQNLKIKYAKQYQIPEGFNITRTVNHLLKLKPKREIIDKVSGFVNQYNIDSNVIGLHIRKTDSSEGVDINFWINTILSNPSKRYFVCSDSEAEENKFKCFPNVIVHPKQEYAIKRWRRRPWIYSNNKGKNVLRSKESVIEALHDLLILSHTNIQDTNKYSTFLQLAKYYNSIIKDIMN